VSRPARRRALAPAREAPRELRARGQATRRKLLDAGAVAFAAKGYHATRVDDVVKVAHTSHGTFYLYFPNKEALFAALAQEVAANMQTLAESLGPLVPGDLGQRALRDWIQDFADLYAKYGAVIRAWTEAEIGGSEFGRLGTDVLTQFARVLTKRIGDVAPAHLEPQIAALAIVAMLERLNYYVLASQVSVERDEMVDTLARVVHAALFAA
jgi:AcrR family transcriptional regulator